MWASPNYFQSACNNQTTLILFGRRVNGFSVNQKDVNFRKWKGWAGFSTALTFLLAVLLLYKLVSTSRARPKNGRDGRMQLAMQKYGPNSANRRLAVLLIGIAFCICIAMSSEWQSTYNCVLTDGIAWHSWGSGQVCAVSSSAHSATDTQNLVQIASLIITCSSMYFVWQAKRLQQFTNDVSTKISRGMPSDIRSHAFKREAEGTGGDKFAPLNLSLPSWQMSTEDVMLRKDHYSADLTSDTTIQENMDYEDFEDGLNVMSDLRHSQIEVTDQSPSYPAVAYIP